MFDSHRQKLILFLLMFNFNCSILQGQDEWETKIDPVTGQSVLIQKPAKYEDMPEAYRASVSKEQYEKLKVSPSANTIVTNHNSELAAKRAIMNSMQTYADGIRIVDIFLNHSDLASELQVTAQQFSEFSEIRKRYTESLKELPKTLSALDRELSIQRLQIEYGGRISAVFLPFQLAEIGRLNVLQIGTAKLLTETKIGGVVELTQTQRNSIVSKSQKIADEIEEFIAKKRLEAAKMIQNELTGDQKEKLSAMYGNKALNAANSVDANMLWRQHDYKRNRKLFNSKPLPIPPLDVWR